MTRKIGLFLSFFLPVTTGFAREIVYRQAPDFPPADSWIQGQHYPPKDIWLNTAPLDWKKLKGKVVLIVFWDYSRIDCIRTLDVLKRWDRDYGQAGLVIIGVHTPEFDFAQDPANVRRAVMRFDLKFPIVIDSESRIWRSYVSNTWPNKFLIGADRRMLFDQAGEGGEAAFEQGIREALLAAHPGLPFAHPIPPDRLTDGWKCGSATSKVYSGAARGNLLAQEGDGKHEEGLPFVSGHWKPEADCQRAQGPIDQNTFLGLPYHGAEVDAVLQHSGAKPVRIFVEQDDHPLDKKHAGKDIAWDEKGESYVDVTEPRLYYLVSNKDGRNHIIRLFPAAPGVGIYSFAFSNKCESEFSHL